MYKETEQGKVIEEVHQENLDQKYKIACDFHSILFAMTLAADKLRDKDWLQSTTAHKSNKSVT